MRYLFLIALNLPIIFLAIVNLITKYKLGKIQKNRFRSRMIFWCSLLVLILLSFPVYNLLYGRPILDAVDLSLFDIFQTTGIIFLLYALINQRQKTEQNDRYMRDLHQEISIRLSIDQRQGSKKNRARK